MPLFKIQDSWVVEYKTWAPAFAGAGPGHLPVAGVTPFSSVIPSEDEVQAWGLKHKTQNAGHRAQSTERKIQNTEHGMQNANLDPRFRGGRAWIPASAGTTEREENRDDKERGQEATAGGSQSIKKEQFIVLTNK